MSDTFNFSLRMPEDLGNTIYEMAKKDKRPMNTTIILLLQQAVKEKTRKRDGKKDNIKRNTTDLGTGNAT
jgi:hypothetical protein